MAEPPGACRLAWLGLRDLARIRRLVFPLYLANLGVALFALLPAYVALVRLTAHRPTLAPLAHTWDLALLAELVADNPALLDAVRGAFFYAPVAYLVLSQLLVGGILGALGRGADRPTLRAFGADAAGSWLPLLRVLLWAGLPYGLAVGGLWAGWALTASAPGWLRALALVPGGVLALMAGAALDLARARAMETGERAAWRAWRGALRALVRRPAAALLLQGGFGLAGLGLAGAMLLLPDSLDAGGTVALVTALACRQLFVLTRLAVRMAGLAAHRRLGLAAGLEPGEVP